jgi:hypothetical protein
VRLRRAGVLASVPLVALGAVAAGLLWGSRGWPLLHDAPIMHYIAWRIGEGAVPYRDLFDMNFPGAYLLHLGVVRVLGPGDLAWRAFDLGWLSLGALAVAGLAWRWGTVAAAGGGLFFVTYHLAAGAWNAGQRDFLLCPFLVAGALGVARWAETGRLAFLVWGGLAVGAGTTIKPHAGVLAAALGVFVILRAWRAGNPLLPPAAALVTGSLLVPAALGTWLALDGALGAWWEIVGEYLVPLYSRLGRPGAWWIHHRAGVWLPIAAAVLVSLGRPLWQRRFTDRHAIAALGVAYGLLHFYAQGKGWEYHLYPLVAFAGVLLCAELAPALQERRPVLGVALVGCLLVVVVLLWTKGREAASAGWVADKQRRVDAIVGELRRRLGNGDTVQVLDTTDGGIHALLRLAVRQPTRFLYDFHFFHDRDAPVVRRLRQEFVHDLGAHPPRFIVLFDRGWPDGDASRIRDFPELAERLATAYRPVASGDGWVLHEERDGS